MDKSKRAGRKKREIKKNPDIPDMTQALVEQLTNLCFVEKTKKQADLLFVFGSNIMQEKLAGIICRLLKQGHFRKVLITGGIADYDRNDLQFRPESEQILSYIPQEVFKSIRFITETVSKNSLENVTEAQKIYDFSQDTEILFLSHSYASRRSKLTLKNICPEKSLFAYPYDIPSGNSSYPVSKASWWKTWIGQSMVWGEYLRILKYGERGDFPIEEVQAQIDSIRKLVPGLAVLQ
jgi:DUF218 domain